MFLRKRALSKRDSVPVAMAGVRMGERLLQIGIDDPRLAGALAVKVGLSGSAAVAVNNARDGERAREIGASVGVFVDVQVAPWSMMPFESASFDLVVVQSTRGLIASMKPEDRVACLQHAHRVLRYGGRILVIESAPRAGLGALFHRHVPNEAYEAHGGAEGALKAEGFRPVRLLGEHGGYRFTEGLKT
jgi:ubiquinone/menaquinone biosynthesis C-methylase UbiE